MRIQNVCLPGQCPFPVTRQHPPLSVAQRGQEPSGRERLWAEWSAPAVWLSLALPKPCLSTIPLLYIYLHVSLNVDGTAVITRRDTWSTRLQLHDQAQTKCQESTHLAHTHISWVFLYLGSNHRLLSLHPLTRWPWALWGPIVRLFLRGKEVNKAVPPVKWCRELCKRFFKLPAMTKAKCSHFLGHSWGAKGQNLTWDAPPVHHLLLRP